jgi:hypothetical protein
MDKKTLFPIFRKQGFLWPTKATDKFNFENFTPV